MITQLLNEWWIKPVALLILVLTLCPPALAQEVSQPQEVTQSDACMDGEKDAASNCNKTVWFIAGCLGTWVGLILAYAIVPSPPATTLLGKSPEYVATYTDCYKRKGKSLQTNTALTGCGIACAAEVVFYLIIIAAASSSTTD